MNKKILYSVNYFRRGKNMDAQTIAVDLYLEWNFGKWNAKYGNCVGTGSTVDEAILNCLIVISAIQPDKDNISNKRSDE